MPIGNLDAAVNDIYGDQSPKRSSFFGINPQLKAEDQPASSYSSALDKEAQDLISVPDQKKTSFFSKLWQQGQEAVSQLQGGPKALAAGIANMTLNAPAAIVNTGDYWAARALGWSDEKAQAYANEKSKNLQVDVGALNNVGKKPAFELPQKSMEALTKPVSQGVSAVTGMNPNESSQAVNAAMMLAPVFKGVGKFSGELGTAAQEGGLIPKIDIVKNFEQKQQQVSPAEEQLEVQKTTKGTQAPTFTIPKEVPDMPIKPLDKSQIASREEALHKVGIENMRISSLENNPKEASSQFITSQASQEPYAQGMTDQINYEKSKLDNHFSDIQAKSGGQVVRYGTEYQVPDQITSGQTIKNGLQNGYKSWQKEGSRIYNEADEKMAGKPVNLDKTSSYLNNDANFAYDAERSLKTGINNYLKSQDLLDEKGNVLPMSVKDAEGLRQYITSKYNPGSWGVGKSLRDSIDKDVFNQVGGSTYQDARKFWAAGKSTYENPKAMGQLLGDQGINEKISDEKVMDNLSGLPQKQFNHIVNTLKDTNQSDAIGQIKTSLVDEIRRSGQSAVNQPYNSIAAANTAAKLSGKLRVAFKDDPEGLQKIYDGIEAGNIIHIPSKYPGAAVQTNLLQNKFSEMALQKGIAGAGGMAGGAVGSMFGPGGTAAGATLGALGATPLAENVATKMRASRQVKQLGKEIKQTKLSDVGKE